MDFVTALANDVHHVNGNDDRYAHLKKLRSEVQIALKVAAVNDVQDGIGFFLNKEISRDNFFQGIGGQGVNTWKVGNLNRLVGLELTSLFLNGNAWPVANILVGAGQRVEQGGFTTVRVAC